MSPSLSCLPSCVDRSEQAEVLDGLGPASALVRVELFLAPQSLMSWASVPPPGGLARVWGLPSV